MLEKNFKGLPWYSYSQEHMNEHMAEHDVGPQGTQKHIVAFLGFDLELCKLQGHNAHDIQTISQNRIIHTLDKDGDKRFHHYIGNIKGFQAQSLDRKEPYDSPISSKLLLCHQAQNLIYGYALGVMDTLNIDILSEIEGEETGDKYRDFLDPDYGVTNTYRSLNYQKSVNDVSPLFDSMIGMQNAIHLGNIDDVRKYYSRRTEIAQEIKAAAQKNHISLSDTPQTNEVLASIQNNHPAKPDLIF